MLGVGSHGSATRRRVVAVVGAAAALGLLGSACSANTGSGSAPVVNVGELADGVTVSGEGEVTGTPDTLQLAFGVSIQRERVDEAVAENAVVATRVQDALKAAGVKEEDIQTRNYSVQATYRYEQGRQTPDGYRVDNTVTAKLKDLKAAGGVIDQVVAAGGNDVRVQGVSFTIEDDTELLAQARDKAFADAKAKAEQYARASGRTLGRAEAIAEGGGSLPVAKFESVAGAMDSAGGAAPTPINPGSTELTLRVTVRYALT